jgi:hypothetical protein
MVGLARICLVSLTAALMSTSGCSSAVEQRAEQDQAPLEQQSATQPDDALEQEAPADEHAAAAPADKPTAADEARALIKPNRISERQAVRWIVLLVFSMVGAFLLILVLHARFYTRPLTEQEFQTEVPRPATPAHKEEQAPPESQQTDDYEFPV